MFIICVTFQQTINNVQRWRFQIVIKVNNELEKQLATQDVMDVCKLVYPKY
jgi:hypothetical protein